MSYHLDPQLETEMTTLRARSAAIRPGARGDWRAMRALGEAGQAFMAGLVPPVAGVRTSTYHATTRDRVSIELRWYQPDTDDVTTECVGGAVVYAHGGGMVLGTLDLYDEMVSWYVAASGVPFLSVGYRRAPDEARGEMLAEDVFAGLTWLIAHADELGVDPERVAVMGDSGGGALAAGTSILARDRDIRLVGQLLIYPMLDDRNQTSDPGRTQYLTWSYDNNYTAWRAVLGDAMGADDVSPVAAPARLDDFTDLAPAYLDVGDLDIFRDEGIDYAARLARAGVAIELHVHPGAPHGWERFAPHSDSARRAMSDRARTIRSFTHVGSRG